MKIANRELRRRLISEKRSIESFLETLDPEDRLNRLNFEEELESINAQLMDLPDGLSDDHIEGVEYASLIFYGGPVVAERGIDAAFSASVLDSFQKLVSSLVASRHDHVGSRGPVSFKKNSALHVTGIVRGSFGFIIEPISRQPELFESETSIALKLASDLLVSLSSPMDFNAQRLIEETDQRALNSAQRFFSTVRRSKAQLRLETSGSSHDISDIGVSLALENVEQIDIQEDVYQQRGVLTGLLPQGHRFELSVDGEIVDGPVSRSLPAETLSRWVQDFIGKNVSVSLKRRDVIKSGELVRTTYSLQDIT